jgi:hypothetical protein
MRRMKLIVQGQGRTFFNLIIKCADDFAKPFSDKSLAPALALDNASVASQKFFT